MNKIVTLPVLLLVVLIFTGFRKIENPVIKIHAYKQVSIPGIIPRLPGDNDINPKNEGAEKKQNFNFWIYLELSNDVNFQITELLIEGNIYDLKMESVEKVPVTKIIYDGSEKNDTVIMVPLTSNKVKLVYPSGLKPGAKPATNFIKKVASKNELVICYRAGNKDYYSTVKELTNLPPDVRP